MTPDESSELDRLLSALCNGQLSAADLSRLETLLEAAAARRRYLEYVDLHGRLLTRPSVDRPVEIRPAPARRFHWPAFVIGAAAAVCVTFGLQSLRPKPEVPSVVQAERPGPPRYVATLAQADGAEWDGPGPASTGARITPGELKLRRGVARLAFDGGASLLLEAGSAVRVESRSAATVLSGRVVFRGDDNPEAFDLRTPRAVLQDYGTEYAVSVTPAGEEIHVFDGEVRRLAGDAEVQLTAGQAVRFAAGDMAGTATALTPDGFARTVRPTPAPADPRDGLLAYDGFDYPDLGTNLDPAAGGVGWVGPWRNLLARPADPSAPLRLFDPARGLSRPGATPSAGGAFDFTGFAKVVRRLAAPLRADADGVQYLSFLVRRGGPSDDKPNAAAVLFRTTTELDADLKGNADLTQRLNVGIDRGNDVSTHLNRVGTRTPLPLTFGQTYLIVAKVVTGKALPDQAFVRVYGPDEAVDWDEPTAWSLVGPQVNSDLTFDLVQLHINSKARQAIDEFRLGATWAAVAHPWVEKR